MAKERGDHSKPAPVLMLGGKPIELNPETASCRRVREYLESLADNDLKYTAEVSTATKVAENTIGADIAHRLPNYRAVLHKQRVWGNPRAILALRELMGQS